MSALSLKVAAARAVGRAVRRAGRGGGTSLPGKVLMRLEPGAIGQLAARLARGSAVISATNGKTTTAAMAAAVLQSEGISIVHNRAGANMSGGIASTLLQAARRRGGIAGELGLFEVDEFWLGELVDALAPRVLVLGNLFRDQLDRYGELETIATRWAEVTARFPADGTLIVNADDPAIADLGRDERSDGGLRANVVAYGVEDPSLALAEMQHASDSKHCRRCGAAYVYSAVFMGHLGHYHCPDCGRTRLAPAVAATAVQLDGITGSRFRLRLPEGEWDVRLPLPGLYNVYNALAAAALCRALGIPGRAIAAGLGDVRAAFGRAETVAVDGRQVSLLLIKNPAGTNEVLRTLALEHDDLDLLAILNDNIADGRDISWVWDADWEIIAPRVRSAVLSGIRAAELAVRLKYAGVDPARLSVVPEIDAGLDAALAGAATERLFVLPTYTALLALRDVLTRRGAAAHYWQPADTEPAAGP